jgi:hypothetical protein
MSLMLLYYYVVHRRSVELCSHLNRRVQRACRAECTNDQATNEATAIERIGEKQTGSNNRRSACVVSDKDQPPIETLGRIDRTMGRALTAAQRTPATPIGIPPARPETLRRGKNGMCSAPFSTKDKGFPRALPCYPGFSPPAFVASWCNCRPWAERMGDAG